MIEKVLFLATLNKVLIDYFSEPLKRKYPKLDLWWLLYIAGLTGLAMGYFSELNLFPTLFPNVIVGRVMTSILVGGGSSLIHKLFEGGVGALQSITVKNYSTAVVDEWQEIEATEEQKERIANALMEIHREKGDI